MNKIVKNILLVLLLMAMPFVMLGQSPCDFDGIHPFCTDDNPMGITYSSGTGSNTAQTFLGQNGAGCLGSTPRAAWFYMQVANPGNLLIYIEQYNLSGTGIDVDFACWGPFPTYDVTTFLTNLCNNTYTLFISTSDDPGSHRPTNGDHSNAQTGGYPYPGNWSGNQIPMTDCSYNGAATEWCFIPNAQVGEIYLLLITNFNGGAGTITFNQVNTSYTSATTDCNILAQIEDNAPICEGQTLMLSYPETGNLPNMSYTWISPDGYVATTTVPNFERINATPNMGGRYKLIRRSGNNVSDTIYSDSIVVTPSPEFVYSIPPGTQFCEGDNFNLTISSSNFDRLYYSINGEPVPTTSYTSYPIPQFQIHSDTTFYIYASNSPFYGDGCYSLDTVTYFCARGSSGLIEDQICVGHNYSGYGFTLPVQNVARDTLLEAHFSNANGCDSISQVLLHITSNPHIELVENLPEHCGHQDGKLVVSVTEGTGSYTYEWSPNAGGTDSLVNIQGQDYTLTVTDSLNCMATRTFTVEALPNPVACFTLIPEAPSYLVGETILFNNCSEYQDFNHWDLGDLNTSEEVGFSYVYNEVGTYTVTLHVSNEVGCEDTYEREVVVHEKTRFYLPNSFTPNGDGINDVFVPVQMEVKDDSYSITIYDRWGNLVFKSNDITEGWDGKVGGKMVATGSTYIYYVKYKDFDDRDYEKNGKVTVVY